MERAVELGCRQTAMLRLREPPYTVRGRGAGGLGPPSWAAGTRSTARDLRSRAHHRSGGARYSSTQCPPVDESHQLTPSRGIAGTDHDPVGTSPDVAASLVNVVPAHRSRKALQPVIYPSPPGERLLGGILRWMVLGQEREKILSPQWFNTQLWHIRKGAGGDITGHATSKGEECGVEEAQKRPTSCRAQVEL